MRGFMNKLSKSVEVHLGRQGRLVIPAALRKLLGFEEGDMLVAREEAGRLVLEKQATVKQRLKARFARVSKDRSLADELIAERREEAKREVAE
jgi:AbrB family looped-hinge helix DNA binding protein